ncbi:MAG: hypothetical protein F6K04_01250 [Leptolyngbya sp. SIO4C5]|uniref:hypothetical protein n=1 Tax=Sphaerothrix gracilis TaxID=3151835 RepID=UPI0013C27614|nr:hypothetical protein [Leptolyngbya sp. SIO4C5]
MKLSKIPRTLALAGFSAFLMAGNCGEMGCGIGGCGSLLSGGSGSSARPMAPPAMEMIEDPDAATEEWEEEVWAKNADEAEGKCEKIADKVGLTTLLKVTQRSQKASKYGDYRFICWFKSEVDNEYTDDLDS